jgi:hypothetical protein
MQVAVCLPESLDAGVPVLPLASCPAGGVFGGAFWGVLELDGSINHGREPSPVGSSGRKCLAPG